MGALSLSLSLSNLARGKASLAHSRPGAVLLLPAQCPAHLALMVAAVREEGRVTSLTENTTQTGPRKPHRNPFSPRECVWHS